MSSEKDQPWFLVSLKDKDVAEMVLVLQRQEAADRNKSKRKERKDKHQRKEVLRKRIEEDFVEIGTEL